MRSGEIHNCPELMDLIQEMGFLPLLDSGIRGYSAENLVDEDNRYVVFDDGEGNFERRGRTPQESFDRMFEHLRRLLPEATDKQITKLIK